MSDPFRPTVSLPPGHKTEGLPQTTPQAGDNEGTLAAPAAGPASLRPVSITLPPHTGRYLILGEIARGGMGAVLLGRDEEMDRPLALKVLFDGFQDDPDGVRRFLEEARVSGQLQHPGVVPIYELGRFPDGRPYFTMKLVQGRNLDALLAGRRDPAAELPRFLKVFEQVCQTLAYAHSRGVIHRDLKPANVMVGEFGEVQVMDWGLAKVIRTPAGGPPQPSAPAAPDAHDAQATEAGAVMGTLAYMPPEQARGEIDSLDERCDVFGLGAILCQILTGQPPYTGPRDDVLERAARGDLAEACARLDACPADPDLLWLAKACLAPDPADRPRDAGSVALTVTTYLAGVQERLRDAELESAAAQARAEEARAKARAERRARRLTLGLSVALVLGAAVIGAGGLWLENQRAEANAAVNAALLDATRLREQARAADADLLRWTEAVGAMQKADALATGGHADADLRRRVAETLTALRDEERQARLRADQADRHYRLLARFEEIRLRLSDVFNQGKRGYARAAADCRVALDANGLDVDALDEKMAAARIRALPPAVAQAVVGALDDWVFAEWADYWTSQERRLPKGKKFNALPLLLGTDPVLNRKLKVWRRRLAIAQEGDADPVRKRLRSAVSRLDLGGFRKIVNSEDVASLPAPTVRLSAEILFALGDVNQAADLLRQAQERRYAGDFWINYRLALFSAQQRPPAWESAARYATAAVALRPTCVEALRMLAYALSHREDTEGAIATCRQLLRVSPDDTVAYKQLGLLFARKGDQKEAVLWYQKAVRLDPEDFMAQWNLGRLLWARGDLDGAAAALRAAGRLRPENAEVQNDLRSVLAQQGKR